MSLWIRLSLVVLLYGAGALGCAVSHQAPSYKEDPAQTDLDWFVFFNDQCGSSMNFFS